MTSRYLAWFVPKDDGTVHISINTAPLEDEVIQEYEEALSVIAEMRPTVVDFLVLERNYLNMCQVEEEITKVFGSKPNPINITADLSIDLHVLVDTNFSNFVRAASAFRHRTEARLRRRYGADSPFVSALIRSMSLEYDASFAYRILYSVRNYAEHFDTPISAVPVHGNTNECGEMEFAVQLVLDKQHLLKSNKLNAKVRAELEATSKVYAIIDLCRDYMRCLANVMLVIFNQQRERLTNLVHYRKAVLSLPNRPQGGIPVIATGEMPAVGEASVEFKQNWSYFSFDELELIGELYRRIAHISYPSKELI